MKAEVINVGDFIYCRSKRHRDQLQLPAEPGLIIEVKRSNFKVLYASEKRAWLPREAISQAPPASNASAFLEKIHYILKRVRAHECELSSAEDWHRLSVRIDRIDQFAMDELRAFLGAAMESLVIVPEGMAFMTLEIAFRANAAG